MAIAAALLEKAARLATRHWADSPAAVERASRLRLRSSELVEADVQAYLGFVAARREARVGAGTGEDAALVSAFELTLTVPLAIVEAAVAAVELAAELIEHGNPNLRADAATAALLAGAAGDSASLLVAVNLAGAPADPRADEAARRASDARSLADRLARSSAGSEDSPRRARR